MSDKVIRDITVPNVEAMECLGARLSPLALWTHAVCFLNGPLGAGKTTLVRGFLRALGYQGAVKSPTYTLVEPYTLPHCHVFHFDLYRLNNAEELEYIGFRDYLAGPGLCFIEWPERGKLPSTLPDLDFHLDYLAMGRKVRIEATNPRAGELTAAL